MYSFREQFSALPVLDWFLISSVQVKYSEIQLATFWYVHPGLILFYHVLNHIF